MEEGSRTCTGCRQTLPAEAFGWRERVAGRRHTRCAGCRAAYQRDWYRAHRDEVIDRTRRTRARRYAQNAVIIEEAKSVPCADCGGSFQTEQMDFDHVCGQKEFNIGDARARVEPERLLAEIAKCDVVCAVCHRVRTTAKARQARVR